jgi:glycosyltransferase involved in cell wall biosynthesis
MAKVSIIMPTYNVEKYFRQCLESVIDQTLLDIEIIPVDDGSPDNCGKIIDEYAAKDSRIKPIHKENGGYGSAVNAGIDAATGEYIGIVETDDIIDKTMYEKLYNKAKEFDADLCKCGFNTYNSFRKNKIKKWKNEIENIEALECNKACKIEELAGLMNYHASIWSCIYKKEFLIENNIRINATQGASYQDYPFAVENYCKAKRIVILPEYLYNWRLEPNQGNSTGHCGKKCMIMAYQCGEVKKILKQFGYYELFKEYMYAHFFHANFTFLVNIEEQYRREYFDKVKELYGEIKNDKTFKYSQMRPSDKYYISLILNDKFEEFYASVKDCSKNNFLQNIFSIRNNNRKTHKIITFMGLKLKIKKVK